MLGGPTANPAVRGLWAVRNGGGGLTPRRRDALAIECCFREGAAGVIKCRGGL